MTPAGILLVPHEAHRGLLDEGVGDSRPPRVWRCPACGAWNDPTRGECSECPQSDTPGNVRALILAWEGREVWQGTVACALARARLEIPLDDGSWGTTAKIPACVRGVFLPHGVAARLIDLRHLCAPLGTVVLVDAEGREIDGEEA